MYLNTHAGNSDASQKPHVLERKDTGRTEWTFGLATVIKQENIIFFFFLHFNKFAFVSSHDTRLVGRERFLFYFFTLAVLTQPRLIQCSGFMHAHVHS